MDIKEFFFNVWIPVLLLIICVANTGNVLSIITYLTIVMLIYVKKSNKKYQKRNKSTQTEISSTTKNNNCQTIIIETREIGTQITENKSLTSTGSQTSNIYNEDKAIQKPSNDDKITTSAENQICNNDIFSNSPPKYNQPADDPYFTLSSLSVLPSSSSEVKAKMKKNGWRRFKKSISKIIHPKKINKN